MNPRIELSLTHIDDKYATYTIHCRSATKSTLHTFQIMLNETYEISGKKRMMDFVIEILEQYEHDTRSTE